MNKDSWIFGLLFVGAVAFLLARPRSQNPPALGLLPSAEARNPFPVVGSVKSLGKQETSSGELLHYKNKEIRSIEWNSDGLPSKIVIEREYYQLP